MAPSSSQSRRRNSMTRGSLTAADIRTVRTGIQQMKAAGWRKVERRTVVSDFGFNEAHRMAKKAAAHIRRRVNQKLYDKKVEQWNLAERIEDIIENAIFSDEASDKIMRAIYRNVPRSKLAEFDFQDTLESMCRTIVMKSATKEEAIRRLEKIEELAEQEEPAEEEPVEIEHADEENGAGISHERHGEPSVNPSTNPPERKIDSSKPKNWFERFFGVPEHRRRRH